MILERNRFLIHAIAVFFYFSSVSAQQIQWASKLVKYSSDLGGKQNGIKRILGAPDAFPQGGPSPNAWSPKNSLSGSEFVAVAFEEPQTVAQVAVFENLNAGCLVRVQVDLGDGKYKTVWSRPVNYKTTYRASLPADRKYYFRRKRRKIEAAPDVSSNAGIEYAVFDAPVGGVTAVRAEFNFSQLPGEKQIDAIGISDSAAPFSVSVTTTAAVEGLSDPVMLDFGDLSVSNPALSADGNTLYMTAEGDKQWIYTSSRSGGKWSAPKPADAALSDNDTFNSLEAIGDGFMLKGGVQYRRGTGECGFEFLQESNGKFYSAGPILIAGYNNYDDTADATTSADASKLIIAIETDFTQGGADLYVATRKDDGSYGLLENMGKAINSAADEGMPQLLRDNKTMIFASNGFSGYGDYDIYVTTRLDESWKKWSAPVSLGPKINSAGFDGSPFYDETSEILYYVRAGENGTKLYQISLPRAALASP